MIEIYGENKNVDYLIKTREIINKACTYSTTKTNSHKEGSEENTGDLLRESLSLLSVASFAELSLLDKAEKLTDKLHLKLDLGKRVKKYYTITIPFTGDQN